MARIKGLIFIILVFSAKCSLALESDGVHRYAIDFIDKDSVIEYREVQEKSGVDMKLVTNNSGVIIIGHYDSEGASFPEIVSVFKACHPEKLFVIISWSADMPELNTGGNIYEVFAYDPKIVRVNGVKSLQSNDSLARKFGIGFDGVREGKYVTYKYKNAGVVKQQLSKWRCR